jgi:hypothetical protein
MKQSNFQKFCQKSLDPTLKSYPVSKPSLDMTPGIFFYIYLFNLRAAFKLLCLGPKKPFDTVSS